MTGSRASIPKKSDYHSLSGLPILLWPETSPVRFATRSATRPHSFAPRDRPALARRVGSPAPCNSRRHPCALSARPLRPRQAGETLDDEKPAKHQTSTARTIMVTSDRILALRCQSTEGITGHRLISGGLPILLRCLPYSSKWRSALPSG